MLRTLILAVMLVCPINLLAATGAVLYQNCTTSSSCTGAGNATGWVRTVQTSGCSTGSCLKLTGLWNSNLGKYGAGSTSIGTTSVSGHDEITVVYSVKFSESSNSISGGLMKALRPYHGGGNYLAATNDVMNDNSPPGPYISGFDELFITKTSAVDNIKIGYPTYCKLLSTNYYQCTTRALYDFTVNGYKNFGTTWRNVRQYLKMPTSATSNDGVWKIWVDNVLLLSATFNRHDEGNDVLSQLTFYPSSDAREPFEHWMDDMIIYEGYVSPDGSVLMPINGACGIAHGDTFETLTSTNPNLCSVGDVANFVTGTTTFNWNCLGQYNGTTVPCLASKTEVPVVDENGVCGAADGTYSLTAPDPATRCLKGTEINFTEDSDAWLWMCDAIGDGTDDPCVTYKTVVTGGNGFIRASGNFSVY